MHLSVGRVVVGLYTVHHTYHAVIISVSRAVVFYKHHLSPHFQLQMPLGGSSTVGEITLHLSVKDVDRRVQSFQMTTVDLVGLPVVGCKQDRLLPIGGGCSGSWFPHAGVECCQRSLVKSVVADVVEQAQKDRILLAVYCSQLDSNILQPLQSLAVEEERRRVYPIHIGSLLVGDHRCKLLHIANHQQLHTPEGTAAAPIASQHSIHRVEQIGSHHAYLINNQQIECTYHVHFRLSQLLLAFGELVFCHQFLHLGQIGAKRQLEEAVYRHASSIHRCHARRCQHHIAF